MQLTASVGCQGVVVDSSAGATQGADTVYPRPAPLAHRPAHVSVHGRAHPARLVVLAQVRLLMEVVSFTGLLARNLVGTSLLLQFLFGLWVWHGQGILRPMLLVL